jgi:hypothetical protein
VIAVSDPPLDKSAALEDAPTTEQPSTEQPSNPVTSLDEGNLLFTIMPVGLPEPLTPVAPEICFELIPPFGEEWPVCVICPAPTEDLGTLYYADSTEIEAICGLTDLSIPAALAF